MGRKELEPDDEVQVLVRLPGVVMESDTVPLWADRNRRIALNASLNQLVEMVNGIPIHRNRILTRDLPARESGRIYRDLSEGMEVEADFLLPAVVGTLPDSAQLSAEYHLVHVKLEGPQLRSLFNAGQPMPRPRIHTHKPTQKQK